MDIITQRFIAIGNKLLAELRLVRNGIEKLAGAVHDAEKAQNQERQQQPPIVRAELQIPEAIEREREKRDERHYRVQIWIAVATSLAVAAAAIYGSVAYFQWKEMSNQSMISGITGRESRTSGAKQLASIQKQFRQDERAWVAISSTGAVVQPPLPLAGVLKIQNIGKTPAMHCILKASVAAAKNEKALRFEFKKGDIVNRADLGTLLPTAAVNAQVSEPDKKIGDSLFLKPLEKARFDAIMQGNPSVFLYGTFTYDDTFKISHSVEFCFVFEENAALRVNTAPFANCLTHNKIDENDE